MNSEPWQTFKMELLQKQLAAESKLKASKWKPTGNCENYEYLILRVILELLRDISKGTKINVYKKQYCTKDELKNSRDSNRIRTRNHFNRKRTLSQYKICCYDILWRKNNFASLDKINLPITSRISMKNL